SGPPRNQSDALEWQIVVGLFQGSREILEVGSPCSPSSARLGASRSRCAASAATLAIEIPTRSSTPAAEHQQLANVDLGAVASLDNIVLPLAILDSYLFVDAVVLPSVFFYYIVKLS